MCKTSKRICWYPEVKYSSKKNILNRPSYSSRWKHQTEIVNLHLGFSCWNLLPLLGCECRLQCSWNCVALSVDSATDDSVGQDNLWSISARCHEDVGVDVHKPAVTAGHVDLAAGIVNMNSLRLQRCIVTPHDVANIVSSVAIISSRWKNWGEGVDKKWGSRGPRAPAYNRHCWNFNSIFSANTETDLLLY